MHTVDGYAATSWRKGYGDYTMRPDLATLRRVPWLPGTALVLCDVLDHHGHGDVPHSPRAMLKAQLQRLEAAGYGARMATELEFFLFRGTPEEIRANGLRLDPVSAYNEDYHILQTTKEEAVLRPLRNHLVAAGVPVEGTKGEAEAGQEELNIRWGDGILAADYHTIAKHAAKEVAWAQRHDGELPAQVAPRPGRQLQPRPPVADQGRQAGVLRRGRRRTGCRTTGRAFLAGLIRHAPEYTFFLAPYVNSYKRFRPGTFAPTRCVWSVDNRTAGFRLVGEGTGGVRVECRIGGSDLNPYLAMAAMLAAGLAGIEGGYELAPAAQGDTYVGDADEIPPTLRAATETLRGSAMLRAAMGDAVVDHYVHAAEWEQAAFDAAVTDWEIERGFELA